MFNLESGDFESGVRGSSIDFDNALSKGRGFSSSYFAGGVQGMLPSLSYSWLWLVNVLKVVSKR